jgi:hypothetical protein
MPHDRALRKSWTVDSALGAPAPYHLAGGIQAQAVRFTPRSMAGRAADPMYKNKTCYGLVLQGTPPVGDSLFLGGLELLQHFYTEHQASGNPKPFFNSFFTMLTGGQALRNAIEAQTPPAAILQSWQQAVNSYRNERKKFLMYPE